VRRTEATASVFLALFNPGDESDHLRAFYENYGPERILCEAKPVFVPLVEPDWHFDADLLKKAVTKRPCDSCELTAQSQRPRVFAGGTFADRGDRD